jgi:hypothetical protein
MIAIDFTAMTATTIRVSGEQRQAKIAGTSVTDTVLLVHGFQGDFGWSAAIDRATGALSLSAAASGVGFSAFGECGAL